MQASNRTITPRGDKGGGKSALATKGKKRGPGLEKGP